MVARIELTLNYRKERMYIPTHTFYDTPLPDETVVALLRVAVIDLWYIVNGGLEDGPLMEYDPFMEDMPRRDDGGADICPTCGGISCGGPDIPF